MMDTIDDAPRLNNEQERNAIYHNNSRISQQDLHLQCASIRPTIVINFFNAQDTELLINWHGALGKGRFEFWRCELNKSQSGNDSRAVIWLSKE